MPIWSRLRLSLLKESQSRFENEELTFVQEMVLPDSIPERKVHKLKQHLVRRGEGGGASSLKDVRQIIALLQELLPYFKKQEQEQYKKIYAKMKAEEKNMMGQWDNVVKTEKIEKVTTKTKKTKATTGRKTTAKKTTRPAKKK